MQRAKGALELLQKGRAKEAIDLLESSLREQPTDAQGWFLLGACHHALKDLPDAIAAFSRSVELEPSNLEAHVARIAVIRESGNSSAALDATSQASRHFPEHPRLYYVAALILEDLRKPEDALAHYDRALHLEPMSEDALLNRGLLLFRMARLEEAEASHRRYAEAFPSSRRAIEARVDALLALGRFEATLDALDRLEQLSPGSVETQIRRGVALAGLRRYDEAKQVFATARTHDEATVRTYLQRIAPGADPDLLLAVENLFLWQCWMALGRCDWSSWSAYASEMRRVPGLADALIEPAAAFMALHLPLSGKECHAVARHIADQLEASINPMPPGPARARPRIRLGLLSPDLREHIMAHLLLPLVKLLDRTCFELYVYSLAAGDSSGIRKEIVASAEHFRELQAMSDQDAAALIRADDIDILIDTAGHTTGGRFGITARRPARLQVLYLGFAASLGTATVDFAIVDRWVGATSDAWSESLVSLPHTYYLYDFRRPTPDVPVNRADYALPQDAFIYCAFHRAEKISPDAFLLWTRVLRQVPNSILWLAPLPDSAQRNLRREASAHGVNPLRLVFAPFESRDDPRYLARHRLGDLMLDALHHNAIATACDALSVGLPVLTLSGSTMASRSGESLLRAAGLSELVAPDKNSYVRLAVALASDHKRLERYRQHLLERSDPLFDTVGRVRELEGAFLEIWRRNGQSH